jgi:hypothetical protein
MMVKKKSIVAVLDKLFYRQVRDSSTTRLIAAASASM